MDKYDVVSAAAEAARTAINDFANKFESAIGKSLLDKDEHEDRFLYAMLDLISDFNEITSGATSIVGARYSEFRENVFRYIYELRAGLDANDPRLEDLFWYDPCKYDGIELDNGEIVNYLDFHGLDDSYVKEELRQVRRHEFFWTAINCDSDESFFEEVTKQSYAIKCLTDPEIEE